MQLSELVTAITDVVQDSDYTDAIIEDLINEAVLAVATGVMIPGKYQLSPPLPDLYTAEDVLTVLGTGYLSLPADYNRDVIMLVDSNGDTIRKKDSWRKFMMEHSAQAAGSVFGYSVNGNNLHYRDIPAAATTLTAHYYTNPETLSEDIDIPSCVPSVLHRKLIVGYVCREIFNQIEDGIEGKKINTAYYANEYTKGLVDLELVIGTDDSPDYYDNQTDYCR